MSKLLLTIASWAAKKLYESVYGEYVQTVAFYCPGTPESRAKRLQELLKTELER